LDANLCLWISFGLRLSLRPSRIEGKMDSIPEPRNTRDMRNSPAAMLPRISRNPRLSRAGFGSGCARLGFRIWTGPDRR
jgi:hypothetical protein